MGRQGLVDLEEAAAQLPRVLADAMRSGMREPGVRIGAGAYETELAMCPVAAAVRYAEKSGDISSDWNPAWGTRADFRRCVLDFVDAFDASAELVGLIPTLHALRGSLERSLQTVESRSAPG
jgi:hypothetical protein